MLKIHTLFATIIFLLIACTPVTKKKPLVVPPQCLKSQSKCFIETEFGLIEILFNQEKILTEVPFKIYLNLVKGDLDKDHLFQDDLTENELVKKIPTVPRFQISKIKSYMEGKEMFMGKIPVMFQLTTQENALVAETLLGSCSEEQMVWRLWLTVFFEKLDGSISDISNKERHQKTFFIDFTSSRF